MSTKPLTYKDAGVDIAAGEDAVDLIRRQVWSTYNANVLQGIGAFGGLMRVPGTESAQCVTIDGVGTKVMVATMAGRLNTVGQDLVHHCTNDLLVQGAVPFFLGDYFAAAKLVPTDMATVIMGMAIACKALNCPIIAGETAEMPGVYRESQWDLAACMTGMVSLDRIVTGKNIQPGDRIIGLPSSGLHTNGYSLARGVIFDRFAMGISDQLPWGVTVADELLAIHRCYTPDVLPILNEMPGAIKGMAHITGGGLPGNLARSFPEGCHAVLHTSKWPVPPIFPFLASAGVGDVEMYRTFNMGIGYALVVGADVTDKVLSHLNLGYRIGEVASGVRGVTIRRD